jgi:DNA-binding NtrC family response regulator
LGVALRDAMERPPLPEDPDGSATMGRIATVLMVDDNPEVLALGAMALQEAGYCVIAAVSAEEALRPVRDGTAIDVLFTDIVMPGGMDGVALARAVQALRPMTPVLLTTGWADRAAEQVDRSDYALIGKPYRPTELVRRIQALLYGHSGDSSDVI